MKLIRFRIQNYKVMDDTGWIPVDEHVTAFVGKNESGKTAILRAMWKSKNVADVTFDKLNDYPRDRYSRERKETQDSTSLEFQLSKEDAAILAKQLSVPEKAIPKKFVHTTRYNGEEEIEKRVTI